MHLKSLEPRERGICILCINEIFGSSQIPEYFDMGTTTVELFIS